MIEALQSLAGRNMLYTHQTEQGAVGYALLQVGCGIPQAFFWGGQEDDGARRMAKLLLKYFSVPTTAAVYSRASTKTFSDLHQKIKQERSLAENGLIYPHKEKNE